MRHKRREMGKARSGPADARSSAAHQVRIIGGQWKRTPLPVLDAAGLRPTPDRVRETVFNWIHHLIGGRWDRLACLDLFAGTGALGFEAASRGAEQVLLVEANAQAARQLEAVKTKLRAPQVAVMHGSALEALQRMAAQEVRFHLIFLDPPYQQGWLERLLPACSKLLSEDGLIYAEAEHPLPADAPPAWMAGLEIARADQAGMVYFHLLQRKKEAEIQA